MVTKGGLLCSLMTGCKGMETTLTTVDAWKMGQPRNDGLLMVFVVGVCLLIVVMLCLCSIYGCFVIRKRDNKITQQASVVKWLKYEHDKLQFEYMSVKRELSEEKKAKEQLNQEIAKLRKELEQRNALGTSSVADESQGCGPMNLPARVIVFRSGDRYHVRQCEGMKSAKSEGRVLTLCAYCTGMSHASSSAE